MSNKFFDQVSGIIKVNLKGKRQEKVINMALARGIYIWGIKKVDDKVQFKVRNSGFAALKNIADESGNDIEIVSEKGLPFFKTVVKRRIGFLTGGLVFILMLYFMTSFVWFVEVSGNKNVTNEHILITAAKHGVHQGAAKWNFSRIRVEEAILRDISNLSYIKIDIRGVKARIEVVEKVLARDEITGPCHMVAAKDGVIEEILILEGQAFAREGEVVTKGDVLISGVVFPEENPYLIKPEGQEAKSEEPYLVRARGIVKAKVWYEGYGECKMTVENVFLSGQKQTRIFFKTPWKVFKLKGNYADDYSLADKKTTTKIVHTPIGEFSLSTEVQKEQLKQVDKYSEEEAVEIAKDKALDTFRKKLSDGQKITDNRVEVLSAPSDPILRVKVSIETLEDIAIAEPLNIDD